MLYDLDILEENVIIEWGGKVSKKYVPKELSQEIHNKAEPFLTWLKEAEEEEESTDEEDDLEVSIFICLLSEFDLKNCKFFNFIRQALKKESSTFNPQHLLNNPHFHYKAV